MSIAPEATKTKRKFVIETNVVVDNTTKEDNPHGIDERRVRDIVDELVVNHRREMKRVNNLNNCSLLYLSRSWSFEKDKKLKKLRSEFEQQVDTKLPAQENNATTIVMIVISVLALLSGILACLKAFAVLPFWSV